MTFLDTDLDTYKKTIRIQVSKEEFDSAEERGYVDGKFIRHQKDGSSCTVFVYAELGYEKDYKRSKHDDLNTQYRCFFGCHVYFAKSAEYRDEGLFSNRTPYSDRVVIIFI